MKTFISRLFYTLLTERGYLRLRFFYKHKRIPNLSDPTTFSEKLLLQKLQPISPLHTTCADKFSVRKHVESRIGDKHLINLIGHFYSAEEFISKFDDLPERFALKASHGSGWNEIVFDKRNLRKSEVFKKVKTWLDDNYYYYGFEKQYKDIRPSIVVEELLIDSNGKVPVDFKFYCFGKSGVNKILVQVDIDRYGTHERLFYDESWNKSEISILSSKSSLSSSNIPKPKSLDVMLSIARKLSSDFSFSRIDLYEHQGNIYFGEITFHPESAYGMYIEPREAEYILGDML